MSLLLIHLSNVGENAIKPTETFEPTEIKSTETSAKLTYANSFDVEFSLLLRERRANTLVNMQEATLEVESNLMAANKLRGK